MLGVDKNIVDRCRMTHWFPAIQKALPVEMYPKTVFVETPEDLKLPEQFDEEPGPGLISLTNRIIVESASVGGFPFFLRNDLISGKHNFFTPCIVRTNNDVMQSIMTIAEETELAQWSYDGTETWAIRELLIPDSEIDHLLFYAFGYKDNLGLPIGVERRLIVRDYKVVDYFPYWPIDSIYAARLHHGGSISKDEVADRVRQLSTQYYEENYKQSLTYWSEKVCSNLEGDWSIDWMLTDRGFCCIDMADADHSWKPSEKDYADWSSKEETKREYEPPRTKSSGGKDILWGIYHEEET